ncbi:aminotransferase class I/II-fold pyridoxal phosphate-dependent enzyme [Candidatus Gracilibacteria bacterium]|nr:aminotransferase class I/II-fold pyridoxal phosphate-dependent enzyme [Candidatus Gracilibacteria bacterium]
MIIDLRTESGYAKYTGLMQEARRVVAHYFDVHENQLVITCGATGALQAVFSHMQKSTVAIMPFEYFDIFTFANLHKCTLLIAETKNDRQNDVAAFCQLIKERSPDLVYVSLPNNPLGQHYSEEEVKMIIDVLSDDQVCVFDQTLLTARPYAASFFRKWGAKKQIIIIGSFSKSHNLVNERIGYMFMPCRPVAFHPYAHAPAAQSLKKVMKVIGTSTYTDKVVAMIEANNAIIAAWAAEQAEFVWSESNTNFGVLHLRTMPIAVFAEQLKQANVLVKTSVDLKCPGNFLRVHLGQSSTSVRSFLKVLESQSFVSA